MQYVSSWYDELAKPSWTPAPQTIGLIWTLLYPIIAVAALATAFKVYRGDLGKLVLVPLVVNLVANVAFTPIFFGMRNLPLATADILVVLATIVWWAFLAWLPGSRWVSGLLIPYFIWVATATTLQVSITLSNR